MIYWDPTGHNVFGDAWGALKNGISQVTDGDNWNNSWEVSKEGFKQGVQNALNTNWSSVFTQSTAAFRTGFTEFMIAKIGKSDYETLTDGKWTVKDAGIIFMAYVNFKASGGNVRGVSIPWTSSSLRGIATSLEKGASSVTVKNRAEAEELFLGLYQGKGYKILLA